jgi:hypothetical protein
MKKAGAGTNNVTYYEAAIYLILSTEEIAGEEGHLECPTCRAPAHVPDQGFPVCVLTGHIQDILIEARENRDASVVPDQSTPTARKGW